MGVAQFMRTVVEGIGGGYERPLNLGRQFGPGCAESLSEKVRIETAAIGQVFGRMHAIGHSFDALTAGDAADRYQGAGDQLLDSCHTDRTVSDSICPGKMQPNGLVLFQTDQDRAGIATERGAIMTEYGFCCCLDDHARRKSFDVVEI